MRKATELLGLSDRCMSAVLLPLLHNVIMCGDAAQYVFLQALLIESSGVVYYDHISAFPEVIQCGCGF